MRVDVMLVKQSSVEVYALDVSDDAPEDAIENAARQRLQDTDWQEDHHGLLKIR
jgi:methylase of polypeptide subunit release factors